MKMLFMIGLGCMFVTQAHAVPGVPLLMIASCSVQGDDATLEIFGSLNSKNGGGIAIIGSGGSKIASAAKLTTSPSGDNIDGTFSTLTGSEAKVSIKFDSTGRGSGDATADDDSVTYACKKGRFPSESNKIK